MATSRVTVAAADLEVLQLRIDGRVVSAPWRQLSPRLAAASQTARETMEISPAGYGIHWPLIDEDLSIDGILRDFDR